MIELSLPQPFSTRPVLVAAFDGWNDAAESATSVIDHLTSLSPALELAALDSDDYYDFQVNRPMIRIGDSGDRRLTWPRTTISWIGAGTLLDRDLLLVRGPEPSMRWQSFTRELADLAESVEVSHAVTLGALLTETPHTRTLPVTIHEDSSTGGSEQSAGSRYEGPTGITGVLNTVLSDRGIRNTGLWAGVPHYVPDPPCPGATQELLGALGTLWGAKFPLQDLPDDARAWVRGADRAIEDDDQLTDYIRQLEEAYDAETLPAASGEAIAAEFERYLRERGED